MKVFSTMSKFNHESSKAFTFELGSLFVDLKLRRRFRVAVRFVRRTSKLNLFLCGKSRYHGKLHEFSRCLAD